MQKILAIGGGGGGTYFVNVNTVKPVHVYQTVSFFINALCISEC